MTELLHKIHFAHTMDPIVASYLEDELLYETIITNTDYKQIFSSLPTVWTGDALGTPEGPAQGRLPSFLLHTSAFPQFLTNLPRVVPKQRRKRINKKMLL